MNKPKLTIKDLHAKVENKDILKGVNLTINGGEIHAIMGPNGTGKSTLSSVIMGQPKYTVTNGSIDLDGNDILKMEVDQRARAGIFLGMQYPSEISGVTNSDFLRTAMNTKEKQVSLFQFAIKLEKAIEELEMQKDLSTRYLNEGFSGGEKKRNEILQMKLLEPKIAILDEIDSGLDVDALRIVGRNVSELAKTRKDEMGILIITHYQRLLDYITPDFVHIMINGKIVKTGNQELAKKVEELGYGWLIDELGITIEEENREEFVRDKFDALGSCATKVAANDK